MASDFPAVYHTGIERGPMAKLYTVDSAATFVPHALVFLNTSDQEIEECGADPALILGWSTGRADQKFLNPLTPGAVGNRVPVEVISPEVEYGMCVNGTLAAGNTMKDYGVVKLASGNWAVDLSDTSATRVTIIGVNVAKQIAFVKFMAASLQGDAIAS